MEGWQRIQIKENLPKLLELTICNSKLLSKLQAKSVFDDADVEEIKTEKTKFDRAKLLYDILLTRTNAYNELITALTETKQIGAAKILTQFSTQNISNLKVSMLGTTHKLNTFLNLDQITEVQTCLNTNLSTEEFLHVSSQVHESISKGAVLELQRSTVPLPYLHYMNRFLSRRIAIDPELFKEKCSDVFVFKCIKLNELRKFVTAHAIVSSTSELLKNKIKARFILLDNEDHWRVIIKNLCGPVHLIRYEDFTRTFVLEETFGNLLFLNKYLHYGNEYQLEELEADEIPFECISEDEFVEKKIANSQVFCICDLPGMGKSLLLASVANKIAQSHPDNFVAYFESKLFNTLDLNWEHVKANPQITLIEKVSTSPLAKFILLELTKCGKLKYELFFDGIDEVNEPDEMIEFLVSILDTIPNSKIYVTTRPSLVYKLENSLAAIAYQIRPLNTEIQCKFLTETWAKGKSTCDKAKLQEYAKTCLQSIKFTLRGNEKAVVGVPLLCKLIADIYRDKAQVYADKSRNSSLTLTNSFANSLSDIYIKYMQRQLGKTKCNFACMTKFTSSEPSCDISCQIRSFHAWHALQIVFPNFANQIAKYVNQFEMLTTQKILSPGILLVDVFEDKLILEFAHRTFAEFLVADYFACAIFTTPLQDTQQRVYQKFAEQLAFDEIFAPLYKPNPVELWQYTPLMHLDVLFMKTSNFQENVVAYFLNALISCSDNVEEYICTASVLSSNSVSCGDFGALRACLHYDYETLFDILIKVIKNSTETMLVSIKNLVRKDIKEAISMLEIAGKFSNASLHRKLYEFGLTYLRIDFVQICTSLKNMFPVAAAIRRADFDVVYFYIEKLCSIQRSFENHGLIYFCFENTYSEDTDIVDKKIDIADFLLSKCPSLLSESWKEHKSPLHMAKVHLKGIKFLISRGVDFRSTYKSQSTIFHIASEYMSEKDFLDLCHYVLIGCNARELFLVYAKLETFFWRPKQNYKLNSQTLLSILCMVTNDKVPSCIQAIDVRKEERDFSLGNEVCMYTILKPMLKSPVYLTCPEAFETLFIMALFDGIVEVVSLLLSHDNSLIERQYDDKTSLFIAAECKSIEMVKLLLSGGANLYRTDNHGYTILHKVAAIGDLNLFHWTLSFIIENQNDIFNRRNVDDSQYFASSENNLTPQPTNFYELLTWTYSGSLGTPLYTAVTSINNLSIDTVDLYIFAEKSSRLQASKANLFNINEFIWGNTIFHKAIESKKNLDILQRLIEYRADWSMKTSLGENVIHLSALNHHCEALEYFIDLGADVNELDSRGNNALQSAVSQWQFRDCYSFCSKTLLIDIIRILLNAGVNKDNKNKDGDTAHSIVAKRGDSNDILKLL